MILPLIDDTPIDAFVRMPAHTKLQDIGVLYIGNGERLTAIDRDSNAAADEMAKAAVGQHRVPFSIRAMIKSHRSLVISTAKWLGRVTYEANHRTEEPHRDSQASRLKRVSNARSCKRRVKLEAIEARPEALGGHSLECVAGVWACKMCRYRSKGWENIAPSCCSGSAASRWAAKARMLAEHDHVDGGGHRRMLSGDLIWCVACGSYANDVAKGLSQPCPSKQHGVWTGGGRLGQLHKLRKNVHPPTGERLDSPLPEYCWDRCSPSGTSSAGKVPVPATASPAHAGMQAANAAQRREALLARVRARGQTPLSALTSGTPRRRLYKKTKAPGYA